MRQLTVKYYISIVLLIVNILSIFMMCPTSSPPSSPTSASDCTPDSHLVDITTSPRKRKASLESLQPDKRPKTVRHFEPIPAPVRRNFATSLGLVQCKPVYFGRSGPLTEPKRTKQTKGDGNCYFRSISYVLSGTEDHHQAIRDQVVNHMTNNISQKLEDYMNQAVLSYLKKTPMQDNGVWATDAEIMATASLLGIDISVYCKVGECMQWLTYPASFNLNDQTSTAIYLENTGVHFNPVTAVA